jgi:hypothetical protein
MWPMCKCQAILYKALEYLSILVFTEFLEFSLEFYITIFVIKNKYGEYTSDTHTHIYIHTFTDI